MHHYTTPYRFVEYPKWVRLPDGREVIAQSKDEEDALLGGFAEKQPEPQIEPKRRGRPPKS